MSLALAATMPVPRALGKPPEKPKKAPREKKQRGRITRAQSSAAYRWVAHVRYRLYREWRSPLVGAAGAPRLVADVEVGFDERGHITSWSLVKPAAGEGAEAFNASLQQLGAKVKRVAKPNAGALALFLKRRIVIRFRTDSPLVRAL